jgi:hypothetical protein
MFHLLILLDEDSFHDDPPKINISRQILEEDANGGVAFSPINTKESKKKA